MKNKKILVFLILGLILINVCYFLIISLTNENKEPPITSNVNEEVYIALYVGDIDGEVSEDWFFFYEKIADFYEKNEIPVVFSFYPASIQNDKAFNKQFLRMYKSEYIELMQKGYRGDEFEMRMDELPYEQQKKIIKDGQDYFIKKMKEIAKTNNVKLPVLYNQIGSRFTEDTKKAAESLGFKFYFDMYVGEGLEPVKPSKTFDVTQYGVSFTVNGEAGGEHKFATSQEIFNELGNFSRDDLETLTVNEKKFIPLWVHQQDFESQTTENELDGEKWKIYTQTILALKEDPNVHLIHPMEAYNLGRNISILNLN